MAREGGKVSRTGAVTRSVRERTGQARAAAAMLARALESPSGAWGVLITLLAAVVASCIVLWAREQPLVAVGRVVDETRQLRVDLESRDRAAETEAQESARARTPRVYVAAGEVLAEIQKSLEGLPQAVASAAGLDRVDETVREKFGLTPELLASMQALASQDPRSWKQAVGRLMSFVERRPILDEAAYQRASTEGLHTTIRLVRPDGTSVLVPRTEALNLAQSDLLAEAMRALVRDAGLFGPPATVAYNRLIREARATYRYDDVQTIADQAGAAAAVQPVLIRTPRGQVLFSRGDVLSETQLQLFRAELAQFPAKAGAQEVWLPRLALVAVAAAVAFAASGYTAIFVPRIRKSPGRMTSAAALLVIALLAACGGTVLYPALDAVTAVCPVLLVAMLLTITYDPRVALAYGVLLATLVCVAIDATIGHFAVLVTGVATAAWQLRDISDRRTMVRAALVTGSSLALATLVAGLLERPLPVAMQEIAVDAGLALAGAVLCGGVTLFILPTVERLFDVATGLTLIELRDPKQPLLRELQQRAPGTYNHSLNVASIAEAAADAIGANALLTYVGGLYHDIGKMNKPEYFVENRSGGTNKHDRLSPALSLLVIVGHVKDGMELAMEFGLPRAVRHFIEAHHGTTLVEYFYHRAKERALAAAQAEDAEIDEAAADLSGGDMPDEVEYRYGGPKPQTKEVAILMIADAVESATRSLPEPTPARIDALVRDLANKRLMDGQFDDCELTLRELNVICESIARTVTSIYHGRIAYPTERARA